MRKLASIQVITEISPIEGADRIELASVLGWKCVVNKGQFHPGDKAVYFEIDSFLPVCPVFEFLRASSYRKTDLMGEGFKLRTMTFRGQISQGLLLPVRDFPEIPENAEVNEDVTELLGVRKYEIEEMETSDGTKIGELPADVPHTYETRVQENPALIQEFAGKEYYISTKMDGTSHSISVDQDGFHVTGHRYEWKNDGKSAFYDLVNERGYEDLCRAHMSRYGLRSFTVQGEYCGPGIRKNRLRLKTPEWYVFTIMENGKRVDLDRMLDICKRLGFVTVPLEETGINLPENYPTVEALLSRADGEYPNGGKKEGIVIRPRRPVYCQMLGGDLSMKVVNNRYLLKNED